MLSESEVKSMYDKAIERATDYALNANNELYELHVYHAISIGRILEIDSKETMSTLKKMITVKYGL